MRQMMTSLFPTETKLCPRCETEWPVTEFRARKDGFCVLCIVCARESKGDFKGFCKLYRKVSKDRIRDYNRKKFRDRRNQWLLAKFGVTIEQYEEMAARQRGVCAICLETEVSVSKLGHKYSLAVDHCHATGRVRGLLCCRCNQGIGHLRDNTILLRRAIGYLSEPQPFTWIDGGVAAC